MAYKGTDIKFAVKLTADGFDMDTDNWELTVMCANGRDKFEISKEDCERVPALSDDPDSSDSEEEEGTWYAIVKTANLAVGQLRVISKAYIVDAAAEGGVRQDIAVANLTKLENP